MTCSAVYTWVKCTSNPNSKPSSRQVTVPLRRLWDMTVFPSFKEQKYRENWGWQYCTSWDVIIDGDLRTGTPHSIRDTQVNQSQLFMVCNTWPHMSTWLQRFRDTYVPGAIWVFVCLFCFLTTLHHHWKNSGPNFVAWLRHATVWATENRNCCHEVYTKINTQRLKQNKFSTEKLAVNEFSKR